MHLALMTTLSAQDVVTREVEATFASYRDWISPVTISQDGERIASSSRDSGVRFRSNQIFDAHSEDYLSD